MEKISIQNKLARQHDIFVSNSLICISDFGVKVRQLRESKGIAREEFCGDETELSVRQLARIETGSLPTLSKAQFIAKRQKANRRIV